MASIWDTLFPKQDYRTEAPSGGYADLYANGLLGNRTDTPTSVGAMETGKDFIPGIGDAIALKEAYDAASRGDKVAAGLLTAGAALGLIPGAGDAVARPVMAAGRKAADVASRIEVDPNAVGSLLGNVRFNKEALEVASKQSDRSREILVNMPINDFLKAAKKEVSQAKLSGTRRLIENGETFDTVPSLAFVNNGDGTGKVVGHDGRHRAIALREAGEDTIPVLLSNQAGDGPSIRYGVQNDPNDRDYVDILPKTLIEEDGSGFVEMPSGAANLRSSTPAQKIAGLLSSGRADDVTDEMLGKLTAQDNSELFDLYQSGATGMDLPMDEASRMARAGDMGFGVEHPLYRGDTVDHPYYQALYDDAIYTSTDPRVSEDYALRRGLISPLIGNRDNFAIDSSFDDFDADGFSEALADAYDSGKSGVNFQSVADGDAFSRHGKVIADTNAFLDPRDIRSRFARFDPRLANLKNLSAGVGVAPIGLLALREEQKRANEEQYKRGLLQ